MSVVFWNEAPVYLLQFRLLLSLLLKHQPERPLGVGVFLACYQHGGCDSDSIRLAFHRDGDGGLWGGVIRGRQACRGLGDLTLSHLPHPSSPPPLPNFLFSSFSSTD